MGGTGKSRKDKISYPLNPSEIPHNTNKLQVATAYGVILGFPYHGLPRIAEKENWLWEQPLKCPNKEKNEARKNWVGKSKGGIVQK